VLIVIEVVLAVVRNVEVFPTVVVVVAHADALAPAGSDEPGLHGYIGERPVVVVAIEMVGRYFARRESFERGAVDNENIRPAVVVVIENGNAGASGLDDVLLGVHTAEHVHHVEPGLLRDIFEIRQPELLCSRGGQEHETAENGGNHRAGAKFAEMMTKKSHPTWKILQAGGAARGPLTLHIAEYGNSSIGVET